MRNAASLQPWCRWFGCVLILLVWHVAPVRAADMFRIQGIPVDAWAESGVAARDLAIAGGQREGLVQLMRRLSSPTAHDHLPDVSGLSIERYVNSFEIAEEKVGPNRYIGVINVSYIADQVRGLLSSAGVPYVTRRSDPILVVPLTVAAGQPEAWLEASPWRAAWYEGIDEATTIVVVLPLGDLADIAAAPPSVIASGDPAALEAMGVRYGAITVIVATATAMDPGLTGPVNVELRRADDWAQPIFQTVVDVPVGSDPMPALESVVGEAILAIEDDWKRRTAEQAAQVSTVEVTVPLADLAGWVQIRRDLSALPEVRWLSVDSFTQSRARVTIGHLGDLERLTAAVGRVGLSLAEETDGWQLRPADALSLPPAPLPAMSVSP